MTIREKRKDSTKRDEKIQRECREPEVRQKNEGEKWVK